MMFWAYSKMKFIKITKDINILDLMGFEPWAANSLPCYITNWAGWDVGKIWVKPNIPCCGLPVCRILIGLGKSLCRVCD